MSKPHELDPHLRERDPGPAGEQTRDRITCPLTRHDTLARLAPRRLADDSRIHQALRDQELHRADEPAFGEPPVSVQR